MPSTHHLSPVWNVSLSYDPARALAAAILAQARVDATSKDPFVQAEALRFWHDEAEVALWADLLDIEPERLRRAAARALGTPTLEV